MAQPCCLNLLGGRSGGEVVQNIQYVLPKFLRQRGKKEEGKGEKEGGREWDAGVW
jgi:hypothetical protein